MGPFVVIEGHPVAELEVEVLPGREGVDPEELLFEYPPPPLDLPVGLRAAHPRVLVFDSESRHHFLERMGRPGDPRVRREFLPVVGEDGAEAYSAGSEPFRRATEEQRERFRLLVRQQPRERDPRRVVHERGEVLLFLRVATLHVPRLVDVDMAEFAGAFLLVPDDTGFPFGDPGQFRRKGFELNDGAGEGLVIVPGAFVEREVADFRPFEDFPHRVAVDGILGGYVAVLPSRTGKACHLAPDVRRDFGVLVHKMGNG